MRFVLLNEGTAASPLTTQITPEWLQRVAAACTIQLNRDVAPEWGGSYGVRAGTDIAAGEIVFSLVDSLPDAPGAVAYHSVSGEAVPFAMLALTTCNTLADVSTAISHELCETAGDVDANLWADDGTGTEWANELCDAVESDSYEIDLGDGQPSILVSDFLLRAFFAPHAAAPYSFAGHAVAPFQTAPGGYQIKRTASADSSQVTASETSKRGARVLAGKHHWSSRPAKRGVAVRHPTEPAPKPETD